MKNNFTTNTLPKTHSEGMGMLGAPPPPKNDVTPDKGRVPIVGGPPPAPDMKRHQSGAPYATVQPVGMPEFKAPDFEADPTMTTPGDMPNTDDWITDKGTVQGQAMGMLEESDSNPMYQYYKNLGEETAGARGWDNSDMQTKAGLNAAYENVIMPAAQQDASLYGQAAMKGQELAGTLDVINSEGAWDSSKMATEYGFQANMENFQTYLDQKLARYGYDRSDRQLMAQLNQGLYSDMIDFSGGAVSNNDLIVTDNVIQWGAQWLEEYLEHDFGF